MGNALSPEITFPGALSFYNFSSLASTTDFTEQSDSYYLYRLHKVSFVFMRSVDEVTMSNNIHGYSLYLGYYPTFSSIVTSFADLQRNQNSYQVDCLTFDKQKVICPISKIASVTTIGADLIYQNSGDIQQVTLAQYLPGQLSIRSDNPVNNGSITLFTIKVVYDVSFYNRK
jgi:hypothetical protein